VRRGAAAAAAALAHGDVVIYTKREVVLGNSADESLALSRLVSDGLVQMVERIEGRPRYIIAKGGITSSDIATRALGVRRAVAPGQVLPGVPVWRLGPESRYPGLAYVVFPGNVGGPDALTRVVRALA